MPLELKELTETKRWDLFVRGRISRVLGRHQSPFSNGVLQIRKREEKKSRQNILCLLSDNAEMQSKLVKVEIKLVLTKFMRYAGITVFLFLITYKALILNGRYGYRQYRNFPFKKQFHDSFSCYPELRHFFR